MTQDKPHPHISRTQAPGMVGVMPPMPQPEQTITMKLSDLTKRQLIALCGLRGVMHHGPKGIKPVSKYQDKGYYLQQMKLQQKNHPLTAEEFAVLMGEPTTSTGTDQPGKDTGNGPDDSDT